MHSISACRWSAMTPDSAGMETDSQVTWIGGAASAMTPDSAGMETRIAQRDVRLLWSAMTPDSAGMKTLRWDRITEACVSPQ